ncbi:hypothetical protein ACFSQJ_17905 [Croceitalea marina]|uniref:Zinc-ribbon 15 domain-containing protein n=1 Tax=Croceitalea marina TaxID=1775166 RepID=A0ABW5N127_9FLAO
MLFFFGTRASKIKERKLKRTTCPYCQTQDSFVVSTFSKYFHFFWIPIIPLFKTNIAECTHCKKSYDKVHFTQEMQRSLDNENRLNPAKRPLWQGCGCLVLVAFFAVMMTISLYGVYMRSKNPEKYKIEVDPRLEFLNADIDKLSSFVQAKDTVTLALKQCVDDDIVGGISTEDIAYFTKQSGDKLLILLEVRDIKKINTKYRKELIAVIEDCMRYTNPKDSITQYFIGIEGKWNTVLIKTPFDEDLGGRFADKQLLLPFYGEKPIVKDDKEMDSVLVE